MVEVQRQSYRCSLWYDLSVEVHDPEETSEFFDIVRLGVVEDG